MANVRVKDLPNANTLADADELIIDSSSAGTRRISYSELKSEVAGDYVAAPSTYKVATLASDNKLDPSQVPDTLSQGLNFVGNANSAGDLTSTTQGDFYVIQTAFGVYSVGDQAVYDGSSYVRVTDGTKQIGEGGTGATTLSGAQTELKIGNIGTRPQDIPLNGFLGDLAFQSSAGVVVDDLTVDGQLTAAVGKPMPVNGPTMRLDGASYVEFADNDVFTFSNSTNDTPFSVSAWIKREDATHFTIASKYNTPNVEYIFRIDNNDKLNLWLYTDTSNVIGLKSDVSLSQTEWLHVAATYTGSGPNSTNSFAKAADGIKLYVNGKAVATTSELYGTYAGMNNTSQPLWVGRFQSTYSKGEIRDVKLFNKELSAAEVREVYSNGQLPESFAESTGAITYVSDFSAGVDGWIANNVAADGNIDGVLGVNDTLRLTADATNAIHSAYQNMSVQHGKRYKLTVDYYIPAGQSNVDGFAIFADSGGPDYFVEENTATLGAWTQVSGELVFSLNGNSNFYIQLRDGGASTFSDAGADDVAYFKNIRITQIGSVLDARAENYNQSAGKLLDVSGNDFVGTQSGGVELLTPRSHLSAGTLDLTNLPTSATGLSAGEVYNDSGTLKIA